MLNHNASPALVATLQAVAQIAPALYTGFTFAYSHVVIPPMTAHASPETLAKQWMQAYKFIPPYVVPLIVSGTLSNATLAYIFAGSPTHASQLYVLAAILIGSIAPYTMLFMESGINGSAKWKVQEILGKAEVVFQGMGPGTEKDSATEKSKRWAESTEIKAIAEMWAFINVWRYVLTGVGVIISATATGMIS